MSFPTSFLDLQNAVIAKARLDASADLTRTKDWLNQVYARVVLETSGSLPTALSANGDLPSVGEPWAKIIEYGALAEAAEFKDDPGLAEFKGRYDEMFAQYRRFLQRTSTVAFPASFIALKNAVIAKAHLDTTDAAHVGNWINAVYARVILETTGSLPTALSANGDLPSLGEPWEKILEYGALAEAASFTGDAQLDRYRDEYQRWLDAYRLYQQRTSATVFPGTFTAIQNAILAKAHLDAADAAHVGSWINQRYAELVLETEFLAGSGTLTLTAGTAQYDLTSVATNGVGRMKNVIVTSGGVVYGPLSQVSLEWILWQRQSSGGQAIDRATAQFYALTGYKMLDLYPTPAAADTLTVYYIGLPTALSGTNVPILGEPYGSKAIEYAALVDAAEFKSDPKLDYWASQAALWRAKLLQHLNLRKGQPGAFEHFHAGRYPPHDPATILPMNGN